MKITYDKEVDAMYIKFQDGSFSRNKEMGDGIILDLGKGNKILGIEILDASRKIKPKNLNYFDIQVPFSLATS